MNKPKKIINTLIFSFTSILSFAQDSTGLNKSETTDFMRSDGKIYVVMAVVLTILSGIFIYLVNLEKKIKRLEKEQYK